MRHRAARSLMTHCPFHSTLDEAAGLCAGVNTNRQHQRVSEGPLTWTRAEQQTCKSSEVNRFLRTSCMTQLKACQWAHGEYNVWLCVFDGSEGCIRHDKRMLGSDSVLCWLIHWTGSSTVAAGWPWREGNLFLSLSVSPSGAFFFSSSEEVKRETFDLTQERHLASPT